MFTVSDAILLSVGHVTVTVTGTVPSCCPAVHSVCCAVAFAKAPDGAVHRYVTAQLIESITVAVTVELCPTFTVHGCHPALPLSRCSGGAGAGGGSRRRGAGGGTYARTPG